MKRSSLSMLVFFLIIIGLQAQSIRKPWRELTSSERTSYVNAVNSLISNGKWNQYVLDHRMPGNGGFAHHADILFLPWHKYFLYYMEQEMGVPLVYWDWEYNQNGLTEWSSASPMFKNTSGGTNGLFNLNLNSGIANSLGRTLNFGSPPSGYVAEYLDQSDFTSFNSALRSGLHDNGHTTIGGLMGNISVSPSDPAFYLHHSMVAKVYQKWVDLYWHGTDLFPTTPIGTVTGKNSENPNNHIRSKTLKVWYADDHFLKLEKYSVSGTETYRYTTGNIEALNFIVPNSTSCTFMADNGYQITLSPGFEAKSGSSFSASISDIASNGRVAANEFSEDIWRNNTENFSEMISVFPNPSTGVVQITLPKSILETFDYNNDYLVTLSKVSERRGTIEVYNSQGLLVLNREILKDPYINIEIKEKGVFIIKVLSNNGNAFNSKVIIF